MSAPYFDNLPKNEQELLKKELYDYQKKKCYICNRVIDPQQPVDVDHIRSKDRGGTDTKNNLGLTHQHCNRAKGNRDLDLQRYIVRFQEERDKHKARGQGEDTFTVGVALDLFGGAKRETIGRLESTSPDGECFIVTWESQGKTRTNSFQIQTDSNNHQIRSFTTLIPIEYIHHDSDINPRSIVDLEPFIEEFYRGHPQLLPSLAHVIINNGRGRIFLFDGQHKAAAQLFLGNRYLYLRVFLNPDIKLLKTTNFGAHTKLAQLHFPMAIQDKVGHDIFRPAFEDYLNSLPDRAGVRESSFMKSLSKEDRSEMRSHYQGYLKFRIVSATGIDNNHFFDYVETVTARSKNKPLAYETVRKAIFNIFIALHETDAPIELASRMRDWERDNLVQILHIFAQKFLVNQFDLSKGIYKIEERLPTDPAIRDPHLRAYRICRQAPLIVVMRELRDAIAQLLSLRGRYQNAEWDKEQVLWAEINQSDWDAINKMFDLVLTHKVWIERNVDYARVLQDTRQKSWEEILLRGTLPGAAKPVYEPLNHAVLLRYASGIK